MRPARRLANLLDAVAVLGPGWRVVGLSDDKVLLRPAPGALPDRDALQAAAAARGLRLSWDGPFGVVARRIAWPAGVPREAPPRHR